jgi:NAD(P) transhydrogenase
LREAALYATGFRKRELYGVSLHLDPTELYATLQKRTAEVVDAMAHDVRQNLGRHGIDLHRGEACVVAPGRVRVDRDDESDELESTIVLIATGSRPYHPPGIPFDDPDVLDPEAVLEIDRAPGSVAVIGGGAIGCEHASIFNALGSRVTLVDRGPRLLPYVDEELSWLLGTTFGELGMEVRSATGVADVARDDGGLRVELDEGTVLRPEKLLVSSGRVGNSDGLGLDAVGVEVDDRGRIVVDERFETTVPGVYAAGDVIGPPALASTSMEQGRVAACHAFGIEFKAAVDPVPPVGVYSIPEVAGVGLTEQDARAQGIAYVVGRGRFTGNARAVISGATGGMVKLVFGRDDRALLGAHLLGESATEAIHVGQAVLQHGDAVDYFINTTFNVPTLCEAYKYAAYDGLQQWRALRP